MPRNKYTYELLAPIVAASTTWAQVCRELGVKPATGAQSHLQRRARSFHIDASHFVGQGWSKGRTFEKRSVVDYLIKDSPVQSHTLRKRLIAEGYKEPKCEQCGLTEWYGEEPPLELDHINSDHFDCRLENLQILCANCHAIKTRACGVTRQPRSV